MREEFFEEFLMQASDGGKWSASRPGGFISGQRSRNIH